MLVLALCLVSLRYRRLVLFRRDQAGRRGAGVAVYVNCSLQAEVWTHPVDSAQFELLWVRVQAVAYITFIGTLYHPPKRQYQTAAMLDYIQAGVDAVITAAYPSATIMLAGDFNTLEVATPTRRAFSGHGGHALSWRSHGHSLAA